MPPLRKSKKKLKMPEKLKLIELVKRHPELYTEPASNTDKQKSWKKIARVLNKDVATCKKCWINTRAAFYRSMGAYKSKIGSNKNTKFYLHDKLVFLLKRKENQQHAEAPPNDDDDDNVPMTSRQAALQRMRPRLNEKPSKSSSRVVAIEPPQLNEAPQRSETLGENCENCKKLVLWPFFHLIRGHFESMNKRQQLMYQEKIIKATCEVLDDKREYPNCTNENGNETMSSINGNGMANSNNVVTLPWPLPIKEEGEEFIMIDSD